MGKMLELEIESLAAGGDGVGRVEGRAVFVPRTVPGDRASVELVRVEQRFARGELVEVLQPGQGRREPACPAFARCGGCSWQHVTEPQQAEARVRIVRDALERIGGCTELPAIEWVPSPSPLGYRSRARVAVSAAAVGFRARASREVVDVERCCVLDVETQAALTELRDAREARKTGEVELHGHGRHVRVGARTYHVSRRSFFQANRCLWERWLDVVSDACGEGELVVELYAGVGFYTAALESRFRRVIAVEHGRAARDARRNCSARVIDAAAEDWAPASLPAAADLVLVNPPRAGCHRTVSDAIEAAGPRRVVYVSCDPATLARDVKRLPTFRVIRLIVLDALPQTHHVETVCVLEKCANS